MIRIDAHQHYWNPGRGDYGWMPKGDPVLDRTYGPSDLAPALAGAGIHRTVLVQAAPTVEETEYMLGLADATPSVAAVVGWVDFEDRDHRDMLARLAGHPKFRGVRPMIQDIPDDDWMLRADVQWGFETVAEFGLTYDMLGFPRHLKNALAILKRYPGLRTVVDHCMKPQIRADSPDAFRHWADGMARIAGETGAYCKLSGLMTEDGAGWTVARLRPYADHVLKVFGPDRVMWASDWPVCRLRAEYADWHSTTLDLTSDLSEAGRAAMFGGTAAAFYRL
jgi:L-fuconolactonase